MPSTVKKLQPLLVLCRKCIDELVLFRDFITDSRTATEIDPNFDANLLAKLTHIHSANLVLSQLYNATTALANIKASYTNGMLVTYTLLNDNTGETTIIECLFIRYSDDYKYCQIRENIETTPRNFFVSVDLISVGGS